VPALIRSTRFSDCGFWIRWDITLRQNCQVDIRQAAPWPNCQAYPLICLLMDGMWRFKLNYPLGREITDISDSLQWTGCKALIRGSIVCSHKVLQRKLRSHCDEFKREVCASAAPAVATWWYNQGYCSVACACPQSRIPVGLQQSVLVIGQSRSWYFLNLQ